MDANDIVMTLEADEEGMPCYVYWHEVLDVVQPPEWAEIFELFDSVARQQAIEALKHAVPGIKIELP